MPTCITRKTKNVTVLFGPSNPALKCILAASGAAQSQKKLAVLSSMLVWYGTAPIKNLLL